MAAAESSAVAGMRKAPSLEWRGGSFESEDEEEEEEEEGKQKLIRTRPSVDWFDVEGNEVSVAQQLEDSEEFDLGRTMFVALQTLAVVFGDIGIGPLYTFDVMVNKNPILGEDDVLGALSLVLYTLILIPLVKYVLVVLWANDDGEVLSAVSGLKVGIPNASQDVVVMISVALLVILYSVQRSIHDIGNAYAIAEVGVMIMATIYVTIIMLLIWETYIIKFLWFPKVKGFFSNVYAQGAITCSAVLPDVFLTLASVVHRYGYKDKKQEHHVVFERLLIEGLEKYIQREAVELSLQSEDDIDSDEEPATPVRIITAPNGSLYMLDVPLLADYAPSTEVIPEASCSTPQHDPVVDFSQNLELELAFIKQAKQTGAVYLIDNPIIKARKDSWFFKKLMINYFYAFLRNNCRRAIMLMSIPHSNMLQVRMISYV
ncbi:hypothetical protein PR202_ga19096 [Eleusine coracana subsp. coracana]|uniref:K+ potassium transporter integral membrane domain-containing protein n=1 Tax=Eleusine coracana subsp. coracana TaxID=191504 RepID=A0AAV5CT34_ELECO|nr:hypothetical protein PR202_ga19096 [Eleusine coracana subsp. coracana]